MVVTVDEKTTFSAVIHARLPVSLKLLSSFDDVIPGESSILYWSQKAYDVRPKGKHTLYRKHLMDHLSRHAEYYVVAMSEAFFEQVMFSSYSTWLVNQPPPLTYPPGIGPYEGLLNHGFP